MSADVKSRRFRVLLYAELARWSTAELFDLSRLSVSGQGPSARAVRRCRRHAKLILFHRGATAPASTSPKEN